MKHYFLVGSGRRTIPSCHSPRPNASSIVSPSFCFADFSVPQSIKLTLENAEQYL